MIKQQLFIGAALIVGVGIGYCLAPRTAPQTPSAEETYHPKKAIADKGADVPRFAEPVTNAFASASDDAQSPSEEKEKRLEPKKLPLAHFNSHREWLEDFKKNNPQGYINMTNNMARWRRRQTERRAMRLDFLSSVSTTGMNAEEKKAHQDLMDLIVRRDDIDAQLQNEDLEDADRQKLFEEMREIENGLREASEIERETLLKETAKTLGLSDETANDFADTIQGIYDATENARGPRRGGPGGGGPGGGGPGGGGPGGGGPR